MAYTFENPDAKPAKSHNILKFLGVVVSTTRVVCRSFGPRHLGRPPWLISLIGIHVKDTWELYNLKEDYSQSKDFAGEHPEKLAELKDLFDKEATDNLVYPIRASIYTVFLHPE